MTKMKFFLATVVFYCLNPPFGTNYNIHTSISGTDISLTSVPREFTMAPGDGGVIHVYNNKKLKYSFFSAEASGRIYLPSLDGEFVVEIPTVLGQFGSAMSLRRLRKSIELEGQLLDKHVLDKRRQINIYKNGKIAGYLLPSESLSNTIIINFFRRGRFGRVNSSIFVSNEKIYIKGKAVHSIDFINIRELSEKTISKGAKKINIQTCEGRYPYLKSPCWGE
jgi:hypothetical protein